MLQNQKKTLPNRLYWHTGWKCLAEMLGMFLQLNIWLPAVANPNHPLCSRVGIGLLCLALLLTGVYWLRAGIRTTKFGAYQSKESGFLSGQPAVHVIASLLLGISSLAFVMLNAGGNYASESALFFLFLSYGWLINITCWLHLRTCKKLNTKPVEPEKSRWWLSSHEEN